MNPRLTDSIWAEWHATVFKPHERRLRRMRQRRQRAVRPVWQFVAGYPVQPGPRFPSTAPVQAPMPLTIYDPKVK